MSTGDHRDTEHCWSPRASRRRVPLALCAALLIAACGSDEAGKGGRDDSIGTGAGGGAASGAAANGGGAASGDPFGNPNGLGGGGREAQDIDGGDDAPDDREVCDSTELVPMVEMVKLPGNILIIFDKSGSMAGLWTSGTGNKWTDATAAVPLALMPLQDDLAQVGAIFFPNNGGCGVDAINAGTQIDFMPGPAFLTAWNTYMMTATPNGNTPLHTALMQADVALMSPVLMNTTIVIIVTDGAPNCTGGDLATIAPLPTAWAARGIKTYAVGLPGSAAANALLNGVAMAGGTATFIPANDSMTLQTEIAKIVQESVKSNISCMIEVKPPPKNPDDVHVIVVEKGKKQDVPRDLGAGGGWTINADGTTIVLQGQFCKEAMEGTYDKISVEFGCVHLPPLPPPKPG